MAEEMSYLDEILMQEVEIRKKKKGFKTSLTSPKKLILSSNGR